jgi:hypothetical protein
MNGLAKPMNMKITCIAICGLFLLAVPLWLMACQNDDSKSPALVWRDAETKRIIFSSDDIISFDWDKQVFHLTDDAVVAFCGDTLLCPSPGMIVEDKDGPVYKTCWYNPISSARCINDPVYKRLDHIYLIRLPTAVPFISIEKGRPGWKNSAEEENDRRFDPRLKAGLDKAGVLGSINLDSIYVKLLSLSTGSDPIEFGEDLKVWVTYYGRAIPYFRVDRKVWGRIFFRGGEKTREQVNRLAIDFKLVANNGTFQSKTRIDTIPAEVIDNGVYSYEFTPWQPEEDWDKFPETDTGLISMTILFQKDGKNIHRLEIPEKTVTIQR